MVFIAPTDYEEEEGHVAGQEGAGDDGHHQGDPPRGCSPEKGIPSTSCFLSLSPSLLTREPAGSRLVTVKLFVLLAQPLLAQLGQDGQPDQQDQDKRDEEGDD